MNNPPLDTVPAMLHSRAPLAAVLVSLAPAAAWGAFHTEFYPTYDFVPVWKDLRTRALSQEPAH